MFAYVRCYLDNVFCLPCDLVSALVQQVVFSQYHARVSLRVPEVRNPGGIYEEQCQVGQSRCEENTIKY